MRPRPPAFQQALSSLICEGVFTKFPDLKVVLLESGFTWLPAHLWRLTKFWRGLRMEVPWLDRAPTEIVKSNVRLTIQPCDGPPTEEMFQKLMEHMDSDELLLFSTDYPHWQFDGDEVLPPGLSQAMVRKIMIDNPQATYRRLAHRCRSSAHVRCRIRHTVDNRQRYAETGHHIRLQITTPA